MKYTTTDGEINMTKIIKHSVIGLFLIIVLVGSFGIIDAGERGVKVRLGEVVGTVDTGLYLKIPFIEKVVKMDVRTQVVKYEIEDALTSASKDLQDVKVSTVVTYHVDPLKVTDLFIQYKNIEGHEDRIVRPNIRDSVKAITSQYTAEELVTKRVEYSDRVRALLNERLNGSFAVVEQSNITNLEFSPSFSQAIEAKVTAVQNAEAAKNKLVQIQYEGQQKVVTAEAEAKAARLISDAANNEKYISLKALEVQEKAIAKWNGVLPTQITPNGTVPFINISK